MGLKLLHTQGNASREHATLLTPIRLFLESHLSPEAYNNILKAFLFFSSPIQSVKSSFVRYRKKLIKIQTPLELGNASARARYTRIALQSDDSISKVSVIVPNYNYARFLAERLDSIVRQTYPIHEIILLDDCSTDHSIEIIRQFQKSSPIPVKVILNSENSGNVFMQWKKGIDAASGDYFWIAEADDSSLPTFLESVMRGFRDQAVVLSYTESRMIDSEGDILSSTAKSLYQPFLTDHWDASYIAPGCFEASHYLSISNTILNVSSVVFRKKNFDPILEQCGSYHLCGDWFFYMNLLQNGDIAFCSTALNLYRIHGGTVRKQTPPATEYREILSIHQFSVSTFPLSPDTILRQRRRRDALGNVPSEIRAKRIAFLMPLPFRGSGGHRTLIQNINAAAAAGYDCDIYYSYFRGPILSAADAAALTEECCGPCSAAIHVGTQLAGRYDLAFATVWQSAADVRDLDVPHKAYFIQDYEPWFLPMGYDYLKAVQSYQFGLAPVTIGRWLAHVMECSFHQRALHFDFCADLNVYHPLPAIKRDRAICAIYQPGKIRRCSDLVIETFRLLSERVPDVALYLFGSAEAGRDAQLCGATGLNILDIDSLCNLYNRCSVGISISSSNPSRIPFEMMAAGLPVIELDLENNRYDFPADGVRLVAPVPEELAASAMDILNDQDLAKRMSSAGLAYMKNYPLTKGFQQFTDAVDELLR